MRPYIILLITITILFFISCNTTEPLNNTGLTLKLEDVSCTEVWVQFTSTGLQLPNTLTLYVDDKVKETINLNTADTLLYVDSLLPNQTYKIAAAMEQSNNRSNEISITTMDTTSHNFTWQTFTFGEHSSSTLYDVAIIDENNIWAVGEIYMLDSLGRPDPNAYNAVHWDGIKWELKRINMLSSCNPVTYPPLKAIWAFSANNIAVTSGGSIGWFDGNANRTDCGIKSLLAGAINKFWGNSNNNLYAVGNAGSIAHYNGSGWTKIESGTTSILNDVWGIKNELNRTIVYCAASSFFVPGDKKILKITDAKVDSVNWNRDVRLYSAWTNNDNFLYVCGEGVFVYRFGTWQQINLPAITTNSIRGNDINDVFAVGSMGTIFHFNGISWKVISSYTQKENYRVDFKNNVVAVGGYYNGKGFVEIGRRN